MSQLTHKKRFRKKWDIFVNLSADSLPVYTPRTLSQLFLGPLKGLNFLTSSVCLTDFIPTKVDDIPSTLPKRNFCPPEFSVSHVEYDSERVVQTSLKIRYGSQWMSLTSSFVEHMAMEMAKPDSLAFQFKEKLKAEHVWFADEIFLPTLIGHHPVYSKTLPTTMDKSRSLSTMENFFSIRLVF